MRSKKIKSKKIVKRDLLFENVKQLIEQARSAVVKQTNSTMVLSYFLIGRMIIEREQSGEIRAAYAKKIIAQLSKKLIREFGKGFSERNLEQMRKFYLLHQFKIPQTLSAEFKKKNSATPIPQTVSAESSALQIFESAAIKKTSSKWAEVFPLSWSHYVLLSRIKEDSERSFYEIEATQGNWSLAEFERQFNAALYERLVLSRDKKKIKELSRKGQVLQKAEDALKNNYVLEFLGLKENAAYSENDLETAIINNIESFLMEMGKGFLFAGRQVRFTFDEENFFVDLVFYNRLLNCFVLIDLKLGKLTHQDLGQMQMYVNYYDRNVKQPSEK